MAGNADDQRPISDQEQRARIREKLLRESWMANDGLWFYEVYATHGIDEANRMNGQVVRKFARLEMVRMLRASRTPVIETFEQYHAMFSMAAQLFVKDMFVYTDHAAAPTHRLDVLQCFAHEGVARAGLDKVYHCGPIQRAVGWVEAMGLEVEVSPGIGLCQKAHTGACRYELTIRDGTGAALSSNTGGQELKPESPPPG